MNAQTIIDEYTSEYLEKSYSIAVNEENNELTVFIYTRRELSSSEVLFDIKGVDRINDFINSLTAVRNKFEEWRKVAKDNNVTDFEKDFDISFPNVVIAWYGSQWWFDFFAKLKPYFRVTSDGTPLVVFHDKVSASSNEYITEEYFLIFTSEKEINSFINKINPMSLRDKLNKKHAPDELFK